MDADRKHSLRGSRKTAAKTAIQVYVEGEWLTFAQIAERIGVTSAAVRGRVARLRTLAKPLTWEALKAPKQAK